MKKVIVALSIILLISIMIAGGSMAWFTSSPEEEISDFKMGTVEVEVIKSSLEDVKVKNIGTSESYVRVRVIPRWNKSSLSVSNVSINFSSNNWTSKQLDGYYYYKYPLKTNDMTKGLIDSVRFGTLTEGYEDAVFTLKVVAEGVQTANDAWKNTWGLDSLPFTPAKL